LAPFCLDGFDWLLAVMNALFSGWRAAADVGTVSLRSHRVQVSGATVCHCFSGGRHDGGYIIRKGEH